MNEVFARIAEVGSKTERFPNCGYLYQNFDELVSLLEPLNSEDLPPVVIRGLICLIQDLASKSICNSFASADWMRYSARSFYCADHLVKYLPENRQESVYSYLNGIFAELMDSGVAPVIEKEVFDKYAKMPLTDDDSLKVYDEL